MGLPVSQEFDGCKVLQVLVVGDNINQSYRAFKIVASGSKSLMNSEELLVMSVVVEFQSRQCLGIVGDRPNLLVRTTNRENASDDIVGDICFHNNWSVQNPMSEDES